MITNMHLKLLDRAEFSTLVKESRIIYNFELVSFGMRYIYVCSDFIDMNYQIGILHNNDHINMRVFEDFHEIIYSDPNDDTGGYRGFIIFDSFNDFVKLKLKSKNDYYMPNDPNDFSDFISIRTRKKYTL